MFSSSESDSTSVRKYYTNGILNLENDAAYYLSNGEFRIPSYDEIQELIDYTNYSLVDNTYYRFTSTINQRDLIIPVTLYANDGLVNSDNNYSTCFWSNTIGLSFGNRISIRSKIICLTEVDDLYIPHYCGSQIRPVLNE